jgi:alkanesulfonate monooxygenase SsuD/methylene tetrahydromethanopterin reductase-like flavin-dependent oxidoreductase (luciferase family)
MRVGLLQEGDLSGGVSCAERYAEMIEEVVCAERAGFSCWGTSEQHFSAPRFSVAAPEVLYAAVSQRTSRIKLRNMAAILLTYNHPVLVAERTATLDILSGGRAELATARSNNVRTIEALGVPTDSTREQWSESLDVIAQAFQTGYFEYDGEFWKIPKRPMVPRPLQHPHPPLYMIATGRDTPAIAAAKGIGMINWDNYMGWEFTKDQVDLYRRTIGDAEPVGAYVHDYVGFYVGTAYCAETREEAIRDAAELTEAYVQQAIDLYGRMPETGPNAYMRKVAEMLEEHKSDIEYLCEHTPTVIVGSPDDFIERFRALEAMGVDEVLLRVDGFGHERNMRAIELIGEAVIPALTPTGTPAS